MRKHNDTANNLMMAAVFTVFFAAVIVLMLFAATSYRNAVSSYDYNTDSRTVLSYISNCVRDGDVAEVYTDKRGGFDCLVVKDRGGFEQLFYVKDGKLLEEVKMHDNEPEPENALAIGNVSFIGFEIQDNGLLVISSDHGKSYVNTSRRSRR